MKALELRVGRQAAAKLASEGWHADLFDGLIGASGGPKWLILGQMDRVLCTELLASRTRALPAIGSSVGSWRHALMAQPDPADLEHGPGPTNHTFKLRNLSHDSRPARQGLH